MLWTFPSEHLLYSSLVVLYNTIARYNYIGEFTMNQENQDFCAGVLVGIIISCVIIAIAGVIKWNVENNGYENKLVIKYHNPTKKYDREMVRNMVNASGIQTNFTNKIFSMDKHWIEYRMTNPSK